MRPLRSWRVRRSGSGSTQYASRQQSLDAPIDDVANLQSPPQPRSIDTRGSPDHVRHSERSQDSSNIAQGSNNISSTSGVTKDGLSKHFFHIPSEAYTTGTRKRRKIHNECDLQRGETRWHKTGKTKPVLVNGRQKGCKKILVLYTNLGKHRKPEKRNWVMHQYHLGELEEEKEGDLVVSKIFYKTQPRQSSWSADHVGRRDSGSCSSSKGFLAKEGMRWVT